MDVGGGSGYSFIEFGGEFIFITKFYYYLELTTVRRNLMYHQVCGGAPTEATIRFSSGNSMRAGIYDEEINDCVSDYVVSSYAPTITTLLSDMPLPTNPLKMVAVIQHDTPDQSSLPCAADEATEN